MVRAHYQSHFWNQASIAIQSHLNATDFGWRMDQKDEYIPVSTMDPIAQEDVMRNIICNCKGKYYSQSLLSNVYFTDTRNSLLCPFL